MKKCRSLPAHTYDETLRWVGHLEKAEVRSGCALPAFSSSLLSLLPLVVVPLVLAVILNPSPPRAQNPPYASLQIPAGTHRFLNALLRGCCTKMRIRLERDVRSPCFTCKFEEKKVDPRGLEPLASAMRGQQSCFLCVLTPRETRIFKPNPKRYGEALFLLFSLRF